MNIRKHIFVFCLLSLCAAAFSPIHAQSEKWGKNNPYVDDKLFHMGFQIGLTVNSYNVTCSEDSVKVWSGDDSGDPVKRTDILHARVYSPGVGVRIGFISDLRLCKYLNLRFTPGIEFPQIKIKYSSASGEEVRNQTGNYLNEINVSPMPIDLPLYLKFSAERLGNFRPYVIAGGGVSFNVYRPSKKPVLLNITDYFCQVGFGCDLYFRWFKLCPEISYRIGFGDVLCPTVKRHDDHDTQNDFYTDAISRMTSQAICLTFNFE